MASSVWRRGKLLTALFATVLMPMLVAQTVPLAAPSRASVGTRLAADLTWTQQERATRFAHMDQLFPSQRVKRSGVMRRLPEGVALPSELVQNYLQQQHLAGVLVLQQGRIRAEQYALGANMATRWTTFSVTKSVTDTLAGIALHTSAIHSLDDNVAFYLPEMRHSSYDGVTVRQLMTMTSGIRWHENYTTADADNVRLYTTSAPTGQNSTIEYMRTLSREAAPGTRWNYNTGETDLLGVLLQRVTGKSLAQQLSATVWRVAGMQADATWIADAPGSRGMEFGGSGLSATLRDLGRYGLWALEGGHGAVPAGWFADAGKAQVATPGGGYGYGWWPQPGGSFAALGIFGQSIFIDPQRQLVVVTLGDWPAATDKSYAAARSAFWRQVQAAADFHSMELQK